jgi:hypothetical protein
VGSRDLRQPPRPSPCLSQRPFPSDRTVRLCVASGHRRIAELADTRRSGPNGLNAPWPSSASSRLSSASRAEWAGDERVLARVGPSECGVDTRVTRSARPAILFDKRAAITLTLTERRQP